MTTSKRIPPHFSHTAHRQRVLAQLGTKSSNLEKYIYLSGLKAREPNLFYDVLLGNMPEIVPILYTPTVGEACTNYSHIWRRPEGLYVSIEDKGRIREVLETWPAGADARISVVTDGSRILGLGDLGANGLPISIGKLDLYVAGAGIDPARTLPICLDLGTNTRRFLEDPVYLGVRRARAAGQEMDEFMDEFMDAMRAVFPQLLVQFEDFSTDAAFRYLARYEERFRCFNDDIQGTGAVVLAGFINAARLAAAASGRALTDHRILFFGAGSAGIGVAKQLLAFFTGLGMSEEQAKQQIYTVDSKGLITADRPGLQEHKKFFARTDYAGPPLTALTDIIAHVRPTALLGLSTIPNAFTRDVVAQMAALNARPIIFPLSNPLALSELSFADALAWTGSTVLFAAGGAYAPVGGREPGQGNNMYVFPGLGLGAVLSGAAHVTGGMVEDAARALAGAVQGGRGEAEEGLMYPRLARIREVSGGVARAVVRRAQADGVDTNTALRAMDDATLLRYIRSKMWLPTLSTSPAADLSGEARL